jgi:hypothetical protein
VTRNQPITLGVHPSYITIAHILLVKKNKMAAQTDFQRFANEKTASGRVRFL